MQMKGQAAQVRVAGSLSKSADVMKAMNQLIKVPEIQKTMQEMSKEMMKVCTSKFCNIHLYTVWTVNDVSVDILYFFII